MKLKISQQKDKSLTTFNKKGLPDLWATLFKFIRLFFIEELPHTWVQAL